MNTASHLRDTIVAVSTPAGSSLRGIVRLSGEQSIPLAAGTVRLATGVLSDMPSYSAAEGLLDLEPRAVEVPVTLLVMRRPRSYTREDVVEIQTYGSPPLLEMILERFLSRGARLAEPGEFTRRAFLNGRIDLAQAAAVRSLIHARSQAAHRRAIEGLAGVPSRELKALRRCLVDLSSRVEAGIDFSDQGIEIISHGTALAAIRHARDLCLDLMSASRETPASDGVLVALFGRPNVGKSSLMNGLLGARRAIVTNVAGTTRDVLDAPVDIGGVRFRLLDTAGVRESDDELEAEAVRRARAAVQSAEIGLFLLDAAAGLAAEDLAVWHDVCVPDSIVVLNKSDLPGVLTAAEVRRSLGDCQVVRVSCVTGEGMEEIKRLLCEHVASGQADASAHSFEFSVRQRDALRRAEAALSRAGEIVEGTGEAALVALETRDALDSVGELTGETATDDILDRIFSEFCIGK